MNCLMMSFCQLIPEPKPWDAITDGINTFSPWSVIKWNTSASSDYSGLWAFTQLPNFSIRHLRNSIWNHALYQSAGFARLCLPKCWVSLFAEVVNRALGARSVRNPVLGKLPLEKGVCLVQETGQLAWAIQTLWKQARYFEIIFAVS